MGIEDERGRKEEGEEKKQQILLTLAQTVPCLPSQGSSDCPSSRVSYREQQSDLRRKLGRIYQLRNSHLLDTIERGVLYPVLSIDWCPSKDAAYNCEKIKDDQFGPDLYVLQGLYEEVRRIEPASGRVETGQPRSYIVLGFKSLDSSVSSVLERTWRDWTGARSIYLNLHSEFDLVKIVFYHRVVPRAKLDLFMYLVIVELANVTSLNLLRLLDFVQRTRVERMNGYISLYRDLGLVDTDSNYFSGEERGESQLSNPIHSANSGSRDSLLASDREDFADLKKHSSCDWSDKRGNPRSHWSERNVSQSTNWRKNSDDSTDSFSKTSTLKSDWRIHTPKSDWKIGYKNSYDWSEQKNFDRLAEPSLLSTDSLEKLNLPAPLEATPCFSYRANRAESPPIGFTSQVSQLREALSLIPDLNKKPAAAARHPNPSVALRQPAPAIALRIRAPNISLRHNNQSTAIRQHTPSSVLRQHTPSSVLRQQTPSTVLRQQTPSTVLGQQTPSTALPQQTPSTALRQRTLTVSQPQVDPHVTSRHYAYSERCSQVQNGPTKQVLDEHAIIEVPIVPMKPVLGWRNSPIISGTIRSSLTIKTKQ